MKPAISLFLMNFIVYLVLVFNYRAVAQGRYAESIISDMIIAFLGFTIVKKISTATTKIEHAAMVISGGAASFLGIYITRMWFNQ